jgi:hypothetical protein
MTRLSPLGGHVGVPRALKNGVNKKRPDRSPSKLPGTSIYREVSSIKVNASLKTHGLFI